MLGRERQLKLPLETKLLDHMGRTYGTSVEARSLELNPRF